MKYELAVGGIAWWFEFLKFIAAVFIAFYIPGSLFLPSKIIKSHLSRFTLATIIGLTLWAWQGFIFGYLQLRYLSYYYLLLCSGFWLLKNDVLLKSFRFIRLFLPASWPKLRPIRRRENKKLILAPFSFLRKNHPVIRLRKVDFLILFLLVLGIYIQVLAPWKNGVSFENGFLFCGGNTSDYLWHASLTHEIIKRMPPREPGLPTLPLINYHYWSNLTIGELVRVFKLSLFDTEFRFFPILISLLLGLSSISLAKFLNLGKKFQVWFLFFTYFGSDLIYLYLFILRQGPNYFIMSSLDDSTKFFSSPPRAFAHVIALCGIILLILWKKYKVNILGILSMLLLASTIGFKIYTSLFLVPGLALLGFVSLLKKEWKEVLIFLLFPFFSALIYLPTNIGAGGLVWTPFMIVNNFIVQPALELERWELARMIFLADKKYFHVLVFEAVFTAFFLIGILGTKIIGFINTPRDLLKLERSFLVLMVVGILTSLPLGILFIQKSGGANTFNFLVSAFLFLSFFAALRMYKWQEKLPKTIFGILAIFIISLTLPRIIFETAKNIRQIYFQNTGYSITKEEIELYQSIPENLQGKVAVDPNYGLVSNTPYASLFLASPPLVIGNGVLGMHSIDISKEENIQKTIFKSSSEAELAKILYDNKINYIILFKNHTLSATESAYFTTRITENKVGEVLQVEKGKLKERLLFYFKTLNDI